MPFKTKEKIKEYNRNYKNNNKEKIRLSQKERRRRSSASPEWVVKRDELSKEDFKKWQIEKRRKRDRDKYARNKKIIEEYKLFHPCLCGEDDIVIAELIWDKIIYLKVADNQQKNVISQIKNFINMIKDSNEELTIKEANKRATD